MAAKNRSQSRSRRQSPDGQALLVLELQEIHSAETQLARALQRLGRAVESEKLKQMLEQRQEEGQRIIDELDTAFEEMEESPGRKKNVAAEGLINDAREHVQELDDGPALDAVLIAAMQKTEHYCIAAWGTARSLAQALDQKTVQKAMERALKEGKSFDEQLTQLAENEVNPQLIAAAGEEAEGEEAEEDEEEEQGGRGSSRSKKGSGSERRQST